MKKKYKYLLAFFIPFLILNFYFIFKKIGVFGDNSLMNSDFEAQYIVFLTYLRNLGNGNLFYSLSKGLGGGMFGTFAYYLSSPFNLILFLFPKDQIVLATTLIITLKISLSGLTMYIYLKNKLKKDDALLLIFSSCYALMSYLINYNFNIMWLDGVMWLPIVMLGIDNIIDKGESKIYIISLAIAIISNYYIGYMICIMSVLYFLANLFVIKRNKKELKEKIIKFIISSIISGLMTMCILIPTMLELKNSYKMGEEVLYNTYNLNIFNLFSRTYLGAHNFDSIICVGLINIYCGLIILPLLYFYFINKNISKRQKLIYGIVFFITLLGFFVGALDNIWQAFNNVTGYYYRYSFIICFMAILLAAISIYKIKSIPKYQYYVFLIFYLLISTVISTLNYKYLNSFSIYVSVGVIILYLLLLYNLDSDKDIKKILIILVIGELTFNIIYSLKDFNYYDNEGYLYSTNELKKSISPYINDKKYRFEENVRYTRNDGLLLNYRGINNFISTNNAKGNKFLVNTGYAGDTLTNIDYGDNLILIDSLLGIKYRVNSKKMDYYDSIDNISLKNYNDFISINYTDNNYKILENPYALSMGYMISNKQVEKSNNPFEYQSNILNSMIGTDESYLKSYDFVKKSDGSYDFTINNNEYLYIYYPFSYENKCQIYVDDDVVSSYNEIVKYINNLDGKTINVSLKCRDKEYNRIPYVYYFDFEKVKNALLTLKENEMDFNIINDGYIKGSVTSSSNKDTLLLTIPNDDGWQLYVDGKKTKIEELYDTFIGVKLKEGKHIVELKYKTPGLYLGIIISFVGILSTILYLNYKKCKVIKKLLTKVVNNDIFKM